MYVAMCVFQASQIRSVACLFNSEQWEVEVENSCSQDYSLAEQWMKLQIDHRIFPKKLAIRAETINTVTKPISA